MQLFFILSKIQKYSMIWNFSLDIILILLWNAVYRLHQLKFDGWHKILSFWQSSNFLSPTSECNSYYRGCSYDTASSYFFRASEVWSILHHGSVGASSEKNEWNLILILTLTVTLNLLFPSIVFHNKICVFIVIFMALSFVRLIFYMRRQHQLDYMYL